MAKNGFNSAVRQGTQKLEHNGNWTTICYWGSVLEQYSYGDQVFFQNQSGTYWLGRVQHNAFMLIIEVPVKTVLEGLRYLSSEDHVKNYMMLMVGSVSR